MQAHIVLAHPEPNSFNGHLTRVAGSALEAAGWQVTMTDLYAIGFDPCERATHYGLNPADRFDVQSAQRSASDQGSIPDVIKAEIEKLDRADLLILQYPMWWHLPPAILKGWLDRVLVYGEVYTSKKRFEHGRFAGKRVLISVTVGTSDETYAHNGRSGDIDLLLWPVQFSFAYVGYKVLRPFVAYGVEAGIRYSDPTAIEQRLKQIELDLADRLRNIESSEALPFNRMAEWGPNGRIVDRAPAYSPFIRHKKDLDLN